jgi:hypothetical protein
MRKVKSTFAVNIVIILMIGRTMTNIKYDSKKRSFKYITIMIIIIIQLNPSFICMRIQQPKGQL